MARPGRHRAAGERLAVVVRRSGPLLAVVVGLLGMHGLLPASSAACEPSAAIGSVRHAVAMSEHPSQLAAAADYVGSVQPRIRAAVAAGDSMSHVTCVSTGPRLDRFAPSTSAVPTDARFLTQLRGTWRPTTDRSRSPPGVDRIALCVSLR
jgi:hypothetical protein